ncbi:MAG: hypothetical protein ACI4SG_01210 [Oligosphaeraceae bacterium]
MMDKLKHFCFLALGMVGWGNMILLMHQPESFLEASRMPNLHWLVVLSYILLVGVGILLCSELVISNAREYKKSFGVFLFSFVFLYAKVLTQVAPSRMACHCVSTLETIKTMKDWSFIGFALAWVFLSCVFLLLTRNSRKGSILDDVCEENDREVEVSE